MSFYLKKASFSYTFWPITEFSSVPLVFTSLAFQFSNSQHSPKVALGHNTQSMFLLILLPRIQKIFFFHFCNHFFPTLTDYCQLQRRNAFHVLPNFLFPRKRISTPKDLSYMHKEYLSFSHPFNFFKLALLQFPSSYLASSFKHFPNSWSLL